MYVCSVHMHMHLHIHLRNTGTWRYGGTISYRRQPVYVCHKHDGLLVVFFTLLMACHFLPFTQDAMDRGWTILQKADPMFFYIILTIFRVLK